MTHFVPDASTVLTWCFPDESSQKAREIAELIAGGQRIAVPAFWRHEILNALLFGEKRKRLTPDLSKAFLEDLQRLPVDIDGGATAFEVFETTQALCRKHGLTAYDAAYLEAAIRVKCSIATVDSELRDAAIAEGVLVL